MAVSKQFNALVLDLLGEVTAIAATLNTRAWRHSAPWALAANR